MARQINRLTTRLVAALVDRAGRGQLRPEDYRRHADGGNLYLVVKENGGIGWSFIYRWHGKPVEIGLGSARDVSFGSARQKAAPMREQLAAGINPKEARKPKEELTFEGAARALIYGPRTDWRVDSPEPFGREGVRLESAVPSTQAETRQRFSLLLSCNRSSARCAKCS